MEEQTQTKKEMYILSLDNSRIAWILSIVVMVMVFLFLLGYWVGRDTEEKIVTKPGSKTTNSTLQSLKNELSLVNTNIQTKTITPNSDIIRKNKPDLKKDLIIKDNTAKSFNSKTEKNEFDSLGGKSGNPNLKMNNYKKDRIYVKKTVRKRVKKTVRKRYTRIRRKNKRKRYTSAARLRYSSRGKYSIQIASHTGKKSANYVIRQLKRKRYRAYLSKKKVKGRSYFRIKVGNFKNYASAKIALRKLKTSRLGRESYITVN